MGNLFLASLPGLPPALAQAGSEQLNTQERPPVSARAQTGNGGLMDIVGARRF